jgi:hypothetical protein
MKSCASGLTSCNLSMHSHFFKAWAHMYGFFLCVCDLLCHWQLLFFFFFFDIKLFRIWCPCHWLLLFFFFFWYIAISTLMSCFIVMAVVEKFYYYYYF